MIDFDTNTTCAQISKTEHALRPRNSPCFVCFLEINPRRQESYKFHLRGSVCTLQNSENDCQNRAQPVKTQVSPAITALQIKIHDRSQGPSEICESPLLDRRERGDDNVENFVIQVSLRCKIYISD